MKELTIKSPAFQHNSPIPKKYSCDGEDTNPPITIEGTPKESKSLALVVDDPDAPGGTFDHWVVWNIPPSTTKIAEHSVPGTEGLNSARQRGFMGPCPPSGTHRYFFKVYALDAELSLGAKSTKKDLEKAMQGHILAKGELIGLYHR
ncbi:MAG: YbhB/YbcL family Raf kinase inhibitor-like protein [Chloroflexi bacterium]|nr:YbhB/YbcL family Raf kinase inhibitor-like protein [Chloroflexota bacterium]MCL5949138.1 YbhB/YbcL family Raf kinase inhibitor-like protein [Candidatus Bathyarchaeota archaeon]